MLNKQLDHIVTFHFYSFTMYFYNFKINKTVNTLGSPDTISDNPYPSSSGSKAVRFLALKDFYNRALFYRFIRLRVKRNLNNHNLRLPPIYTKHIALRVELSPVYKFPVFLHCRSVMRCSVLSTLRRKNSIQFTKVK